ncbi:MAG TPA: hypothetical protein VMU17_01890, partial [Elusimicrobiota bacterium]|nr:hypothetical protein [Elusimicrobiota bacterium]
TEARRWRLHVLWPLVMAIVLLLRVWPLYRLSAEEWSRLKYGEIYLSVQKMGEEIGKNLQPGETFYELGYEPGLYYYSGRRPPTGILMADHWETGPLQAQLMSRIIKDLERNQPELLVTTRFWIANAEHAQLPLTQWCMAHYRPFPRDARHGPFLLLARKGGALESRLTAARPD